MIRLVTDSTAYLRKQEAEDLGILVVPISYCADGHCYQESYADQNPGFECLLNSGAQLTTAQPNPAAFLGVFQEALAQGDQVLCVTLSSRLSGTYAAAHMAARQAGNENVLVFDSRLTAGGLLLLLEEARALVDAGLSLAETAQRLAGVRDKISVAFSVDDMGPLRSSGRLSFVRANVRTILNIRPILLCRDGVVLFDTAARGSAGIIEKLAEKIPPQAKAAVVGYIEDARTASNLYNVIRERHPDLPVRLQKMGPVLGIHLGLRVVAVSHILL